MNRVLIVDDHVSMRDTFSKLFTEMDGFTVVGDIGNASYALMYCQKLLPDLVLLDICTEEGASGLDAAQEIHLEMPKTKIILMTAFEDISYIERAREAGASGFIYKSKSLSFFAEVARKVMKGESYFPQAVAVPVSTGEEPLTKREMEVLRLVCKHMNNREIGEELFISENTVKYHKVNMLAKTGFPTILDLAFYMISNGWINPKY